MKTIKQNSQLLNYVHGFIALWHVDVVTMTLAYLLC